MHSLLQSLVPLPFNMEHSYLSNLDNEYLTYDRLTFYEEEKLFTFKCPVPSLFDYFTAPACMDFDRAYNIQEKQYFTSQKFLDRQNTLLNIEKVFNYMFSGFGSSIKEQSTTNTPQGFKNPQSAINNGTQLPTPEFKHIGSLNLQLKSKSIIGLLFLTAILILMFRITKKSEQMKQKIPKTLSIFWLYSAIQLYLDLNVFQLDTKPFSKMLFLELVAFDHTSVYIPELLHLILVIASFLYFISLILRFNEIFGHDDVELVVEQMSNQKNNQGQGSINGNQQELGGIVSQSLIQVDPLSIRSSLEFYHFIVLHVVLLLTFIKLVLLNYGLLFVKLNNLAINTLDNLELFPTSPRYLALYTISFLSFSQYIGRTPIDRIQYIFQKIIPFFIGFLHSTILMLKRRYIFTLDDLFFCIMFITSICLYFTYESPNAELSNRYPWPFLHSEMNKRKSDDQVKQLIKSSSEYDNIKLTKEQIERRQQMIDSALRKRQQEHEEYMRKKDEIQRQKIMNMDDSPYANFSSYGNEDESEEYDNKDTQNQQQQKQSNTYMGISNEAAAKVAQMRLQELILQQLNQLNDESKKILQLGGGIDLSNDSEIIQKLGLLASIKAAQEQSTKDFVQQQQVVQQDLQQPQPVIQQQPQAQVTQGGQGQQLNLKQTAHKAPTKAPTGRPNQRKRR